ncbi:MAG: isocitrate dehydrogenase kinase/phosphatase AceK regulatory subunit, partial [Desulfobacterales bacterium]
MTQRATHNQLTHICAEAIFKAFNEYQAKFKVITRRAKTRFENRDWHGMRTDSDERLDLYKKQVDQIVVEIIYLLKDRINDKEIW